MYLRCFCVETYRGGMLAASAEDNCAQPVGELFDNGNSLSSSGADPRGCEVLTGAFCARKRAERKRHVYGGNRE